MARMRDGRAARPSIGHPVIATNSRSELLPVVALLFAATFWGILWWPLRWLADNGIPGLWASLLLFVSASVLGLPLLWRQRAQWARHPTALIGLALASGWCNTAFILAVLDGEVVRVLLLFYLSPVWAVLLAWLILRERPPAIAWLTLSLAIGGALVILWDSELGVPWPQDRADLLALSSGMAFALSNVLVRRADTASIGFKTVVSWLGVVVLATIMITLNQGPPPVWNATAVTAGVALGAFGMALMSMCLVYGVTHLPVHRSSVILLFVVVAGAASAQWRAGEMLEARVWLGGAFILAAAWFAGRQSASH